MLKANLLKQSCRRGERLQQPAQQGHSAAAIRRAPCGGVAWLTSGGHCPSSSHIVYSPGRVLAPSCLSLPIRNMKLIIAVTVCC